MTLYQATQSKILPIHLRNDSHMSGWRYCKPLKSMFIAEATIGGEKEAQHIFLKINVLKMQNRFRSLINLIISKFWKRHTVVFL